YTLAVDHTGSRARLPLSCLAALHIQCVMHPLDRAVIIPAGQIVVHRALWGQVLGQIAPLAAGAQHIHHTVHHFSHHHRAVAPTMFGWWDLRLDQRPLLIGQVRWVAQLVAVVAGAVLGRPHPAPLAKQAPWTESQVIRAAQAQPATDSNDSHSFRTDTYSYHSGLQEDDRINVDKSWSTHSWTDFTREQQAHIVDDSYGASVAKS